MEIEIKRIITIAILFILVCVCHAGIAPEPNEPNFVKAGSSIENAEIDSTKTLVPEKQRTTDQIEAVLAKEYYKDCVQNLKWALGIIIGLLVGFVGYAIFKSGREYRDTLADVKQALGDAREACREARVASDKAREYEEKAQERMSSVDKVVASKLKEIEEKSKTLMAGLIQEADKQRGESQKEAEKQRKIIELWNKGLHAFQTEDYELASKCFESIVKDFKVENSSVYNNWGSAIVNLARRKEDMESKALFMSSLKKYEKAVQNDPDCPDYYYNWGLSLLDLVKRTDVVESEELLKESFDKFQKAIQINPNYYKAYNDGGIVLLELAKSKEGMESKSLFMASFKNFEKALQIKTDYQEAYNNWANLLIEMAKRENAEDKIRLMEEAKQKCVKAESIKEGSGAYNFACACALLGDEIECRKWLEIGERCGTLTTRSHAMSDEDLESVRDKEWFKQIHWPEKPK